MTEVLDHTFLELPLNEISDMLLQKLCENHKRGKRYSMAKLVGKDETGKRVELSLCMRYVKDD